MRRRKPLKISCGLKQGLLPFFCHQPSTSKKHVRSHLTEAIENFRAEGPSCYSPGCSESASAGPGAIIPPFRSEACKADTVVTSPSNNKQLFEVIEQKKRPNRRPQFLKQLASS